MEMIIEKELWRHFSYVRSAEDILYSNPKHIKGIFQYKDKKKLYDLRQKIEKKRMTLSYKEFQFLESIVQKYG